ncbi:hypothetical protein HOY80DRAFT_1048161 [Tuber brumale]|nr:hypothetical protein HOY80DRAFT_1048161 [Tuber brumale]
MYWREAPPGGYGQEADLVETVRLGRRGLQTSYAGVGDVGEGGESQGVLWIILVLIEIGVAIWVIFTVMIALGTWWAGLFRSDQVEDWEEGKREV